MINEVESVDESVKVTSMAIRTALLNCARSAQSNVSMIDFISVLTYEYARLLYVASDFNELPRHVVLAMHIVNLMNALIIGTITRDSSATEDETRNAVTDVLRTICNMNKEQINEYLNERRSSLT